MLIKKFKHRTAVLTQSVLGNQNEKKYFFNITIAIFIPDKVFFVITKTFLF